MFLSILTTCRSPYSFGLSHIGFGKCLNFYACSCIPIREFPSSIGAVTEWLTWYASSLEINYQLLIIAIDRLLSDFPWEPEFESLWCRMCIFGSYFLAVGLASHLRINSGLNLLEIINIYVIFTFFII